MADVSFVLELVDKLSGTADKMSAALKKVEGGAHAAGKEADSFFDRVSAANKHLKDEFLDGIADKFAVFELAKKGVEMLEELAEKAAEVTAEFVKSTVEAGLFEQKSKIAFEGLTGSAEKGEAVLKEVKGFANQFGESYAKVSELFKTGLLAGLKFEGKQSITELAQAALDLEKIGGKPAQGLLQAFAEIKERGEFSARSLMLFKDSGIPFDQLAKKLGVASGSFKSLQEHLTQTKVTADQGIGAIMSVLGDRFGTVGAIAHKNAKLLDGQIQTLKNSWDDLLGRVADSGALDKVGKIIEKISESLSGEKGERWAGLFDRLFESAAKFIDKLSTKEGMDHFTEQLFRIGAAIEQIAELTIKILPFITKLVSIFGSVAIDQLGTYVNMANDVSSVQDKLNKYNPLMRLFGGGQDAKSEELVSKMPGFAEGAYVDRPTVGLFGEAGPEYVVPESKVGALGGGVHAPITQTIHVHAEAGVSLEELARAIHRIGLSDLQGSIDTLAQQMGAA